MIVFDFKLLFSIEFIHDFFNKEEDMLRDLLIKPDVDTEKLLNNYRMKYRIDNNKLLCFVQTKTNSDVSDNRPLVDFNANDILKFKLIVTNGQFLNYTNLPLFETENKIYHFANDSSNQINSTYFLSRPIVAYEPAGIYQMGMLASDGTNIREAIQYINSEVFADPHFWTDPLVVTGYVNHGDLVTRIYKENEKEEMCFGEIEILLSRSLPEDFNLLKPDNTLREMKYIIHFKNRSTYWNYKLKTAATLNSVPIGNITFHTDATGLIVSSNKPVELKSRSINKILLNNDSTKVLPVADATILKFGQIPPDIKSKIISEIIINN